MALFNFCFLLRQYAHFGALSLIGPQQTQCQLCVMFGALEHLSGDIKYLSKKTLATNCMCKLYVQYREMNLI